MNLRQQIVALVIGAGLFVVILDLVRRRRLDERSSCLWLLTGLGVLVLAVDNLPCELALESSVDFSRSLKPFVHAIASADYNVRFEQLDLPVPIKKAMILHNGELTPEYQYMERFLS